jgi:uncharacterized protein (UPF0297 family)
MSELENIDNVDEVEVIPTDKQENVEETTGEVSGEVTEVPEDNSAEIEAEQERLRREHEEYLNSFPSTTVFYRDLLVDGNIKKLGMATKDARVADSYKILDNHFDESELTYIGTKECGIWYLKGYEKPEPTEEEKMKAYAKMIEMQVDRHLQELCDSKGYDDVKSCVGYFNSTDETFQKEARAMIVYRDHLYRTGYNIIEKCQKGEIDYHTVTLEYVLSLIDPIDW